MILGSLLEIGYAMPLFFLSRERRLNHHECCVIPSPLQKDMMADLAFRRATKAFSTVLDFLRYGITKSHEHQLYFGHGTQRAQDDIWALIAGTLSLPFDCNPLFLQARVTDEEKDLLVDRLTARIIKRIPVPYILQEAHFCELTFFVDERVLIPRSPIAELIRQQFSPWIEADSVMRILDLCTGSGCIAIACCEAFPDAYVDAIDVSLPALEVAAINQARYHLEEQLTLIHSDCWQSIPHANRYDIIVSNPPYVGDEEMLTLPKEYCHEPDMALRATNNGLAIVEEILKKAASYLNEKGILVVEVGNSEDALVEAYPNVPFMWLEFECGGEGVFMLTREQLQEFFS